MRFAVIRHPDVPNVATAHELAMPAMRAAGWVRVSEYRPEPGDFHLPDFADATADLDASVAPEPAEPETTEPAPTRKRSGQ